MLLLPAFVSLFSLITANFTLFPYTTNDGSAGNAVDNVKGFGNTTAISKACSTALNTTILCDTRVQYLASSNTYGALNGTGPAICNATCGHSLSTYHSGVAAACAGVSVFGGMPNSWLGDIMWSFYNMTCLTDPTTSEYCSDYITNQVMANPGAPITDPLDLPTSILCSSCQLSLWRAMQSSAYSGYDDIQATVWTAIQAKCGVSYPVGVASSIFNVTLPNTTNGSSSASAKCLSGNTYVVKTGDTCKTIALAKSVSEGSLQIINAIFPDCSNMQVNQTLCLPKTCMTHLVGGNDTCASVALQNNIALPILIGYNPAINSQCSNLDLNGSVICLSPAFGTFTPTTISGVAATQTGTYATSTIAPPGATAYKSTTQCGSWYLVHPGDYCGVISLSNGIALSLFMLINPAIDPACDNLVPGLYYCVQPTMDWNITTPSGTAGPPVTQSAPAPTQSGTTSGCFQWYVVAANDTCALIEESYGLTPQQFIAWNPSLNALCTNFILGDAYCVYGPYLSVSSTITSHPTSTTSKSTTTTTSHSSTTSSSSCTKTYTVVSGDTCYIIYTKYALTAAQFMALNPSLNAACALSVGQVVCIAGPTSPTSTSHTSVPTATPTSSCTKNYTVVSGDTCSLIATKFAITAAQLHAWNPTLDAACDLSIGQVLCVASPTSTAPTCPKTYTVVSGDTCYSIYTKLGITDAQLVAWNPTLDAACDLSVGQVLCVAAPISCTKTYTVVSGDSCYSIYTKLGITDAQLVAWNPGLDAACDLSVGQVLCVAA